MPHPPQTPDVNEPVHCETEVDIGLNVHLCLLAKQRKVNVTAKVFHRTAAV